MPAGPGCIHIGQLWSILFLYGVSGFSGRASDLRPLLAIARCEGSACGGLFQGSPVAPLRRRPHSRSVAACVSLALATLCHADDRQLHSASRPLSSFALAVCQVDRSVCVSRCSPWADRLSSQSLPLPWERRSPARRVRREGDTCLSPGVTRGWGSGRALTILRELGGLRGNCHFMFPYSGK